jgi:hypothetical protein
VTAANSRLPSVSANQVTTWPTDTCGTRRLARWAACSVGALSRVLGAVSLVLVAGNHRVDIDDYCRSARSLRCPFR